MLRTYNIIQIITRAVTESFSLRTIKSLHCRPSQQSPYHITTVKVVTEVLILWDYKLKVAYPLQWTDTIKVTMKALTESYKYTISTALSLPSPRGHTHSWWWCWGQTSGPLDLVTLPLLDQSAHCKIYIKPWLSKEFSLQSYHNATA